MQNNRFCRAKRESHTYECLTSHALRAIVHDVPAPLGPLTTQPKPSNGGSFGVSSLEENGCYYSLELAKE